MNKKIKLLQDWSGHKAGDVLEVDVKTFGELTTGASAGTAAEFTEVDQKAAEEAAKALDARISAAVIAGMKSVMAEVNKARPTDALVSITVKDNSDEDPSHGYLPPTTKQRDPAELRYGFGLFCADVHAAEKAGGTVPERLVKARQRSAEVIEKGRAFMSKDAMNATSATDGGFLIPPEFSLALINGSLERAIIRPRATPLNLMTNAIDLPVTEDNDHSSDVVHGGVAAYWTGESQQYTQSKPKIGAIGLKLNKLTCLGFITDELMRFSGVTMGGFLLAKFQDAIAWKEDVAFLEGTGAGMPLGILKTPALVVIAKETEQSAGTILAPNLAKMFGRCRVANDASVAWITNRQNFPQLFALKDSSGNALWVPGQSAANRPNNTLLGYPVEYCEKMAVAGTQGDIVLADLSHYLVADDSQGPQIAQSIHLRFDYGEEAFRVTKFVDGRPSCKQALTPRKGDTISPFVVIAVRA